MQPKPHSVTIVVPCYNEAQRLSLPSFESALDDQPGLSLLFVDDGSSDGTGAVLGEFCAKDPGRIALVKLDANRGKGEAVRRGLLEALKDGDRFVGYWDADLATPLWEVPRFAAELEGDPGLLLVMGSRVQLLGRRIERRPVRHYAGRVFATAASMSLGIPVYDTQCGAKLLRGSDLVREALREEFRTRWIFDVEMLFRIRRLLADGAEWSWPGCLKEIPLRQWIDVAGSKVRPLDLFRGLHELWRLRRSR